MSETNYGDVKYFCDVCKSTRKLKITRSDHEQLITNSPNGLVLYSDVHICENGITGVNNLQIDGEYHVRSFVTLKLPEYQAQSSLIPKPGIPKPDNLTTMRILELPFDPHLNLIIEFNMLNSKIIIGGRNFDQTSLDKAKYLILSDFTGVSISIFSISSSSEYIDEWFSNLANTLELIPATKLGLIIESLKYIADIYHNPPSEFDIVFLRTILTSHEVYFIIDDLSEMMNLPARYPSTFNEENMTIIEKFVAVLMDNQFLSLQDFNQMVDRDVIYLIYLLLLLEKEHIIVIERPGIVEY